MEYLEMSKEIVATYGVNVVAAAIVFVVGRWFAKLLTSILERMMIRGYDRA